jgi:hypothetical protein
VRRTTAQRLLPRSPNPPAACPAALLPTCSMCIAVTRGRTRVMRCSGVCFWLNLCQDGSQAGRAFRQDGSQAGERRGPPFKAAAAACMPAAQSAYCILHRTPSPHPLTTHHTAPVDRRPLPAHLPTMLDRPRSMHAPQRSKPMASGQSSHWYRRPAMGYRPVGGWVGG